MSKKSKIKNIHKTDYQVNHMGCLNSSVNSVMHWKKEEFYLADPDFASLDPDFTSLDPDFATVIHAPQITFPLIQA